LREPLNLAFRPRSWWSPAAISARHSREDPAREPAREPARPARPFPKRSTRSVVPPLTRV